MGTINKCSNFILDVKAWPVKTV